MSCETELKAFDDAETKLREMDDRLKAAVDELTSGRLPAGMRFDSWNREFADVRSDWRKAVVVRVEAQTALTKALAEHTESTA